MLEVSSGQLLVFYCSNSVSAEYQQRKHTDTQKKTIRQLYFKHIMRPLAGDGSTGGVKSRSKSVVTCSFSVENDEFGSMFCNSSNHL